MAVVLRLSRAGKHKSPAYRIVATDKHTRRDGNFIEVVGIYNPLRNPASVTIKEDLVKKWLAVGAQPTEVVASIFKKQFPGLLEARIEHKKKKVLAARQKRKAAAKSKGAPKAAKASKTKSKKA